MRDSEKKDTSKSTRFATEQCRQCVEILKQVLAKPGSRPKALLEAIAGGTSDCKIESKNNGVVIRLESELEKKQTVGTKLPEEPINEHSETNTTKSSLLTKRWTRPLFGSSSNSNSTSPQPLAASAATERSMKSLSIDCRPCGTTGPEGGARAFVMGPNPLSVVVCSNRLHSLESSIITSQDTDEMEQVLVHELMHVFDVQQLKLDLQDCFQLAYSEVRAAREAECHGFSWHIPQSYCVQQKARTATSNMFPNQGKACVEKVLSRALADNRPFESSAGATAPDVSPTTAPAQEVLKSPEKTIVDSTGLQHYMPYPSDR